MAQINGVPGDKEIPLIEHIQELRSRILIIVVGVGVAIGVAFPFSGILIQIIWRDVIPANIPPVIYGPLELIITRLTLSLIIALVVGVPLLMYETLMFIGKGLYPSEKRFFIKVVPFSFLLFLIGASLAYFVAVPIVFKQTILYSIDIASPQVSLSKTFSLIATLVAGFGLAFQFPLLLIFAIKMGLVKRKQLSSKRIYIYGALLAFAFLVAQDPTAISELILAGVLILLFEFSLLISRVF
jgi:sec-independent protein translocase protein TatC